MIRRLVATALVIALIGGGSTGAAAQGTDTSRVTTSSDSGLPLGTMLLLLVAITVAWGLLAVVVMRRQRRRRRQVRALQAQARRRRMPSPAGETGGFVPMAPVTAPPEEDLDDELAHAEALEPEPEPESEPAGPFEAYDRRPVAEPVPEELPVPVREMISEATTYEIVWYRDEARLHFALQPVDGRAASWAKLHSGTFTWAEDADPPADLRDAQRAHGRLRTRLVREGWRPAGRGERWFSHRFRPPARP